MMSKMPIVESGIWMESTIMLKVIKTGAISILCAIGVSGVRASEDTSLKNEATKAVMSLVAASPIHRDCMESLKLQLGPAVDDLRRYREKFGWDSEILSFNLGASYITENYILVGHGRKGASIILGPIGRVIMLDGEKYAVMVDLLSSAATAQYEKREPNAQDLGCRVVIFKNGNKVKVFSSYVDLVGRDYDVIDEFDGAVNDVLPDDLDQKLKIIM